MKSFVQFNKGRTPRQAHVDLDGLKDDELGRDAFQGRQAQLYRRHDPTRYRAGGRLRSTAFRPEKLDVPDATDPDAEPLRLLYNDDCQVYFSRRSAPMPWYRRNVDGDEVHFVHKGEGHVETEFGPIPFERGDYVVIPKAVTHRWVPTTDDNLFLIAEAVGEFQVPDYGPFGRHTPYDPTLIFVPEPEVHEAPAGDEVEVRVKYDGGIEPIFYEHHPLDVEGWKGDYFPFKLNIRDWNVVMSDTLHLVPTMHVFVEAPGVLIVNFLPRPLESKPGVERLPYYHRNADYDEVTFFHAGSMLGHEFPPGWLVHAPQGIHHGPPEELREFARESFDEFDRIDWEIISVDTRRPMRIAPEVAAQLGGTGGSWRDEQQADS